MLYSIKRNFKKMVINANGKTGASLSFLNDTEMDTIVRPTINGKNASRFHINL